MDLDWGGLRSREIDRCAGFLPQNGEGQNLRADENEGSDNYDLGAARKVADLGARLAIREFEYKERKKQLSSEERKPGFRHGVRQLRDDGMAVGGNIDRLPVCVAHDAECR